jgi:uncharacterized protein YlxW (UPF0749 family)
MSMTGARPADPDAARRGPAGLRRPDESMTLLREVMEQPLDPSYQLAAERRATGERPGRRWLGVVAVMAVFGGWATTQGVAELRRPQPGQIAGRAALEQEISRRTARADATQVRIQQLGARIAAAQQQLLTRAGDAELAAQAQRLASAAGESPVTGPGLEITVHTGGPSTPSDAADPRVPTSDTGRVLDRDLQVIVNGLWAAGAEAVAINGRRLTAVSAIRSAGEAILVDFRPLVPPYVVQAVGDPTALQSGFAGDMAGSYVQLLRNNYGVDVEIASAQRLTLPGAGTFRLVQATVLATPSTSASSGASSGQPSSEMPSTSSSAGQAPTTSTSVTPSSSPEVS